MLFSTFKRELAKKVANQTTEYNKSLGVRMRALADMNMNPDKKQFKHYQRALYKRTLTYHIA